MLYLLPPALHHLIRVWSVAVTTYWPFSFSSKKRVGNSSRVRSGQRLRVWNSKTPRPSPGTGHFMSTDHSTNPARQCLAQHYSTPHKEHNTRAHYTKNTTLQHTTQSTQCATTYHHATMTQQEIATERDRQTDRQTDRETQREREREITPRRKRTHTPGSHHKTHHITNKTHTYSTQHWPTAEASKNTSKQQRHTTKHTTSRHNTPQPNTAMHTTTHHTIN